MGEFAQSLDIVLGQEFLTWLWFKSDVSPDSFVTGAGEHFSVSMEQRIVVQGGDGDSKETASVQGAFSSLSEARFGLGTGKKVVRALLRLEKDDMAFQLSAKAEDFTMNSVRTPKIEREANDEDDPDALLLEKIYFLETVVELWDSLYVSFLRLRLSDAWDGEVRDMRQWMTSTVQS
ncbi:MAG: hypothetical protein K5657_05755 [Desulfovibrio sp.]|nr:hypothetical protein [Desulfovibrio sp.]